MSKLETAHLGEWLMAQPTCLDPDVEGLAPDQKAALHLLKAEIKASLNKCYLTVPNDRVNTLVVKYINRLLEM